MSGEDDALAAARLTHRRALDQAARFVDFMMEQGVRPNELAMVGSMITSYAYMASYEEKRAEFLQINVDLVRTCGLDVSRRLAELQSGALAEAFGPAAEKRGPVEE